MKRLAMTTDNTRPLNANCYHDAQVLDFGGDLPENRVVG